MTTEQDQEIKVLISKRGQLKAKISRSKTFFDKCTDSQSVEELKLRLHRLEQCWDEFEQIQGKIETIDSDRDHTCDREEFENQYFQLCGKINNFIKIHTQSINRPASTFNSNSSLHTAEHSSISVKLPTINLPRFSGKYEDWIPFFDTFTSLIDQNDSLNPTQKLHYLRASLQGDAADVIKSLELTASNYNVAVSLLKDQFHNTRLIVQQHIKKLFDQPHVQKESATSIRQLVNTTHTHMRSLEALDIKTDTWDPIIIHLVSTKLDAVTHKEWETSTKPNELPTLKELTDFLQNRCQILENVLHNRPNNPQISAIHQSQKYYVNHKPKVHISVQEQSKCRVCNGKHNVYQCQQLIQASPDERTKKLSSARLCFNCLGFGHKVEQCVSSGCKRCGKKHNTALHYSSSDTRFNTLTSPQNTTTNSSETKALSSNTSTQGNTEVLLSTALVEVISPTGERITCRAFLDNGSQSSFITESLCQKLQLRKSASSLIVRGINEGSTHVKNKVDATLKSRQTDYEVKSTFLVLPKITGLLPTAPINTKLWNVPNNIVLADPTFAKPAKIDILLGQEHFFDILEDGQIKKPNMPFLQNTKLGWIFGGRVNSVRSVSPTTCHLSTMDRIDQNLQAFWRLEEPTNKKLMTSEERNCEEQYASSVQRTDEGRYIVAMPLNDCTSNLGTSRETAVRRFLQIEKRFKRQPALQQEYTKFMNEYEELGHMEVVQQETNDNCSYYLPHHPVIKESSTTTKLRVVFDASSKTSTGISLNDILFPGPTLQDDLFSIIIRFRLHLYVFTADIEKMYRQIWIDPNQRNLLKIVWRTDSSRPLQTYKLKTVTYGTACAPYLAVKTLHELAKAEEHTYPEAAMVVLKDFYVDDLLTGSDNLQDAQRLQTQIFTLLKSGGFNLRKWKSNCCTLLECLPADLLDHKAHEFPSTTTSTSKTLGLIWDSKQDSLQVTYSTGKKEERHISTITKRTVLSEIAKLFDPLGIISPIIIRAKIFLQDLWLQKLDWDEFLPKELQRKWDNFQTCLRALDRINIQRCVKMTHSEGQGHVELHGFCDASEKAYGGVIYVKHSYNGSSNVTLLCAKSKVAPVKLQTLPRLELCGAVLLSELMAHVKHAIGERKIANIYYWTDSSIVLSWLSVDAAHWKTFVANRVSKIQELSDPQHWRHVRSDDNPADLVSRGSTTEDLMTSNIWISGPQWLLHKHEDWPSMTHDTISDNSILERKKHIITATTINTQQDEEFINIVNRFSSFKKLQRVTAFCKRFINNCRFPDSKLAGPLLPEELKASLHSLVKADQNIYFLKDIYDLKTKHQVHKKSKIITLNPFMDSKGIIRVGGRLNNSQLKHDQKHPILLSDKSQLTKLIISHEHIRALHAGPQLLLSIVRQQFWPINGKNIARKIVHQCIPCFKTNPKFIQPQMGNLPSHRITQGRPFLNTGVDYCGPIYIRSGHTRRCTLIKSYIAVFVCFTTRAIHLELVSDLTTEAFLAAFKRFTSRRGVCQHVYSDNGTNFVGAYSELKELYILLQNKEHQHKVIDSTAQQQIHWHFIPPKSPHFGGLWEAGVRSVKQHLRKVIGTANLRYDELYTVLTMIESCLNSRPLTPLSTDPNDPSPLTPGHFLIGQPMTSIPEPDYTTIPVNRLSRWQHSQQLMQHFWRRWSTEYLNQLQQRQKWSTPDTNIQPGQVVMVREDNLPPLKWITAIVEEVHPGADGKVRVATVKTSTGQLKRAVNRLCVLPIEQSN